MALWPPRIQVLSQMKAGSAPGKIYQVGQSQDSILQLDIFLQQLLAISTQRKIIGPRYILKMNHIRGRVDFKKLPAGIAAEAKSIWGPDPGGWAYCRISLCDPIREDQSTLAYTPLAETSTTDGICTSALTGTLIYREGNVFA